MTGVPFDAATLERWGVVNRVLPDDGFDAAARAFASSLAEGPTRAHAATKRIVRRYVEGGVDAADADTGRIAGGLFATTTCRTRSGRSWTRGRVRPLSRGAEQGATRPPAAERPSLLRFRPSEVGSMRAGRP